MRSGSTLGVALLFAVASAGCGKREQLSEELHLADLFPLAEKLVESTVIAPGDAASRHHLQEGWSPGNPNAAEPFAWGIGWRSVVSLTIVEPRPFELVLRGRPYRFPDAPRQIVELALNGQVVDRLALDESSRPRAYSVELAAEAQTVGSNYVELRYAYSRQPDHGFRRLAAAWSELDLRGARPGRPPEVSGRDLLLPARTGVSFSLPNAAGGELTIDRLSAWKGRRRNTDGPGAPTLRVLIERADGEESAAFEIRADGSGQEGHSIPLPVTESPLRLTLTVITGDERRLKRAGLRLYSPTLRIPPPVAATTAERAAKRRGPNRPNVLIYLIDTLRADHLGCYGYARPTSPRIDRFAEEGVLFTAATAQSSWTRPTVASLFTGLNPQVHGTNSRHAALPLEAPVLAELFRDLGYATAAVSTNRNISRHFRFDRGFETFVSLHERTETTEIHQLSDRVNEEAFAWLDQRPEDQPFLLYLHTTDPHAPYEPRSPFREEFAAAAAGVITDSRETLDALQRNRLEPTPEIRQALIDLYDGEIAFNDAAFGALVDELVRRDLYDSTLIVVLADHGEEFADHGRWTHGRTLYEEQLRVPLIVRLPDGLGGGRRTAVPARQIDLLPTLLEYVGASAPSEVQGRSLLPWLLRGASASREHVPSYALLAMAPPALRSVEMSGHKLIYADASIGRPARQLFDLEQDPAETRNLAYEQSVWSAYLQSLLDSTRFWQPLVASEVELDGELRKTLKALGYLQ